MLMITNSTIKMDEEQLNQYFYSMIGVENLSLKRQSGYMLLSNT